MELLVKNLDNLVEGSYYSHQTLKYSYYYYCYCSIYRQLDVSPVEKRKYKEDVPDQRWLYVAVG
jgi:hypothetical protein